MATNTTSPLRFLNGTAARVLTGVLLLQGVLLYAMSRSEIVPSAPPLSAFPMQIGDWQLKQEGYVDEETRQVLKADDLLTRTYAREGQAPINLFIAAFRSQRTGKAPHSPKNCLPGSGWVEDTAGTVLIDIPGKGPIEVNRYIVTKGGSRALVLYWYQSFQRTVASEYMAKAYVIADSIRYNRTDTALIRVWTPVAGSDDAGALQTASTFVQSAYPSLHNYLPQ